MLSWGLPQTERGGVDNKVLINLLAEIAVLEESLVAAEHTLSHHASRGRDLRDLQAEYEEDAALAQAGDQNANVRLRGKENEIRATETALTLKRDQTIGVSDRRQYQALQREISGLEQKLITLEDEAMALLATVEAAEDGRDVAESDRVQQESKGQAEIDRMQGETTAASEARDQLAADLQRLISMLPEANRRHVQRLRQNGGPAVVQVQSGACGGCFEQLPAQQGIDADKGRSLVRCAGCARYVVHRPWR